MARDVGAKGTKPADTKATDLRPRSRGESPTSPRRLTAAEKKVQALELRKAGATFPAIAKALGYRSHVSAINAVKTALQATFREPADELRKVEMERLDVATFAVWPKVQGGDLRAIDRLLRIMRRRASLLGLDLPVGMGGDDTGSLDALMAEMRRRAAMDDDDLNGPEDPADD